MSTAHHLRVAAPDRAVIPRGVEARHRHEIFGMVEAAASLREIDEVIEETGLLPDDRASLWLLAWSLIGLRG
jgi:hypothetical protein